MARRGGPRLLAVIAVLCLVGCHPDSNGSGGPPVRGGPPGDPDSVTRKGGNGRHGLDHNLRLLGIAPIQGPTTGGTDVLIVGFNFQQAGPITEVLFGGEPALDYVVRSNNQIDSVSPPHLAGLAGVTVRNAAGEEDTLDDIYEYVAQPPTCISLNPPSGTDAGGTTVTIETENFTDDFTLTLPFVYFDTVQAAAVSALDARSVSVITPPDPNPTPPPNVHPVDVTVESADGLESCVFPQGYTYVGPTAGPCAYITPPGGSAGGGETVIVISLGPCQWAPNSTVTFGGLPATNVVVISPTQLSCTTPPAPAPGAVDVEITGGTPTDPCTCLVPGGFIYQ